MSTSEKKRRPLRKLLSFAVLAGIVVAVKNARKDKGGSFEAPAAAPSPAASVPTPPVPTPPTPNVRLVTAEDIVEKRPVENLDEFADPVEPAADPDDLGEAPDQADPLGNR